MKKFYFLGLAMLFGAIGVGHAQVQITTFDKLKEVGQVFSDARNASSSLAAKNKELEDAKKDVETAKDALTAANNELVLAKNDSTSAETKLATATNNQSTAQANYNSVKRSYDAAETNLQKAKDKLATLKEALEKAKTEGTETSVTFGLEEKQQYIDFLEATEDESDDEENVKTIYYSVSKIGIVSFSISAISGFTPITSKDYSALGTAISGKTVTSIKFYYNYQEGEDPTIKSGTQGASIAASTNADALLGAFYGVISSYNGTVKTVKKVDPAVVSAAQEKVDDQEEIVAERQTTFDNASADLEEANGILTAANTAVTNANTALETAKGKTAAAWRKIETANNNIKTANAKVTRIEGEITTINANVNKANEYKSLSITANIIIPETYKINETDEVSVNGKDFTLGDWGSDYTIAGNGNVITYPAGANGALTGINRGMIINLGVVNGKIATTNGGSIKTAFETMDQNTYDLYDATGTHTTSPISGELGYKVRQYFGLTINADGTLGTLDKKTADNTVYKAEWTKADTKTTATFYANVKAGDLSYNPAANKKNMFVYVQDTEINATAFTVGKNIVVNGECQNAVFVDDAAEGDDGWVYIPTAFTAKNLIYERVFKSTALATTCLPFEVPAEYFDAMGLEKIMQFSNVDTQTGTYWFQYQDGSMKANEPYVLKFKNNGADIPNGGKIFQALKDIDVAATGNIDRYEVAPSRRGTGAEFLGVFVSTNASMLARGGYKLYGFGNGVFRPMTVSADNKCQAFRTYIKTPETSNAPATDLVIGELDELGNVVSGGTTGVNAAVADADAFSVKGGNGVVIITTGKAQKVSVYTVGGSLVKAASVEAGTVTVPVAAGVYIVNGKKVVVK